MKPTPVKIYSLLFSIPFLLAPYELLAGNHGKSPCEKSAKQMFQACHADIMDNFKTTQANCTNLATRSERAACLGEAKTVRKEESDYCKDQLVARADACEVLGEHRYATDPLLDPSIAFVDPDEVDQSSANPYVSIVAGHTYVVRAGEEGEETVVVHVTGETRVIQDVPCRVVADAVVVVEEDEATGESEYVPVEITDDWFAQDIDGNVYYCGEVSRNFEEGILVDIDGSFESGRDFAKAGTLIMAMPEVGLAHRQEFSLGEAEDIIQYVDTSGIPTIENENFPCADAGGCLMTYDFSPLAPESSEFKYYSPGIGFVLAEAMQDGEFTGETEQLLCAGDSLAILEDPACEIDDPAELLEALCKLAPEAFCD